MKKILFSLCTLTLLLVTACNLDLKPTSSISTEEALRSMDDAQKLRRDIYITMHDQGDDMPPRTQEISLYFDTVKDQVEPDAYSIDNYCYFITEHSKSMSYDGYMEFLFEPKTNDLVFSYTRAREEGEEHEWRYYYDENGKCIETKSNSQETDEGFYDKRAAKDYVAIMKFLLEE